MGFTITLWLRFQKVRNPAIPEIQVIIFTINPDSDILLWINFALEDILRYHVNAMPNSQSNAVT